MSEPLFVGVDIGTGSSKGVAVRADGRVLARAIRPHRTATPRPGWFEHDAEAVWWADFTGIVRDLLTADGVDARAVAGVGVSGIGPCLLPADTSGRPLRPAILYGVDTRATAEIAELTAELGAEEILARGGSPLTSQAVGPKLRWLARHEPEVWRRTRRFFMASSWLVHRLTGEYRLDHHSASQCDPLYDLDARRWNGAWAQRVAPGLDLPALAWPGEVVGTVHPAAAEATGLPEGTPVTAGTIDAWAEAASVDALAPGDTMVMYGSTMFLTVMGERPMRHPALWGTTGVRPGSYCLAAGMATSGSLTDWLRDLTGSDFATLLAEAEQVPPGARGLLMLPYFAGERTPLFDPRARGTVIGLTLRHGRAELYRAALEATAFGVRHNLEAFADAGARIDRLVAVGGGARGLWTAVVSAAIGLPQRIPAETVGACFGDTVLVARALGAEAEGWNPVVAAVAPDEEWRAVYDARYPLYRELYEATRHIGHALADSAP
ncbi:sugar kinase [Streptomyces hygroscopicus subsp. sporocinereus]|uniref:Sugar kinase n=1 Tax=Streptomyces hygroscopicus TaxID=1912 RepID=A0ABQ3UCE7_STRHY|nr:FGGY-family carbohydrate kinase [Streptomyces hygroscopicus]GHJ33290.1 sugar kinase [Streptomyces hygroscopicus]